MRKREMVMSSSFQARRLMTLHRIRRNTISNDKTHETYEIAKKNSSCTDTLPKHSKSFDEDGYLSPMEIKAKVIRTFAFFFEINTSQYSLAR